jgi:hypothetical protein
LCCKPTITLHHIHGLYDHEFHSSDYPSHHLCCYLFYFWFLSFWHYIDLNVVMQWKPATTIVVICVMTSSEMRNHVQWNAKHWVALLCFYSYPTMSYEMAIFATNIVLDYSAQQWLSRVPKVVIAYAKSGYRVWQECLVRSKFKS